MEYTYGFESAIEALLSFLGGLIPSSALGVASYVLTALGLYTIAKRRGLNHPWLAWVPVADMWLLGSLSDQYRYITRRENKSKRKSLLILGILMKVLGIVMLVLMIAAVVQMISSATIGMGNDALVESIVGTCLSLLGLLIPFAGVAIAYTIIRYMALYDLYKSLDPDNCVMFLVLSILFGVTEPFFLFFNREKDLGMPPRRKPEAPQQIPQEPWTEEKNYL